MEGKLIKSRTIRITPQKGNTVKEEYPHLLPFTHHQESLKLPNTSFSESDKLFLMTYTRLAKELEEQSRKEVMRHILQDMQRKYINKYRAYKTSCIQFMDEEKLDNEKVELVLTGQNDRIPKLDDPIFIMELSKKYNRAPKEPKFPLGITNKDFDEYWGTYIKVFRHKLKDNKRKVMREQKDFMEDIEGRGPLPVQMLARGNTHRKIKLRDKLEKSKSLIGLGGLR